MDLRSLLRKTRETRTMLRLVRESKESIEDRQRKLDLPSTGKNNYDMWVGWFNSTEKIDGIDVEQLIGSARRRVNEYRHREIVDLAEGRYRT